MCSSLRQMLRHQLQLTHAPHRWWSTTGALPDSHPLRRALSPSRAFRSGLSQRRALAAPRSPQATMQPGKLDLVTLSPANVLVTKVSLLAGPFRLPKVRATCSEARQACWSPGKARLIQTHAAGGRQRAPAAGATLCTTLEALRSKASSSLREQQPGLEVCFTAASCAWPAEAGQRCRTARLC